MPLIVTGPGLQCWAEDYYYTLVVSLAGHKQIFT